MEKEKLLVNVGRPPLGLNNSLGSSPTNSNSNSMEYHHHNQVGMGLGDLNCFLNLNWDSSMMGVDDSALSSMVSSPLAPPPPPPPPTTCTNSLVIRELIGRLGSICNSGGEAQFNNSNMLDLDQNTPHNPNPSLDPGFYERAARYCQLNSIPPPTLDNGKLSRVSSSQSLKPNAISDRKLLSRPCTPDNPEFDESSASEPNLKDVNNSKKRKAAKSKPKELHPASIKNSKATTKDDDESNAKRCKASENDKEKVVEPPKDYIHVRARRGQATDSHSLAERVRREKISERMKFLQDLVPGCNKVTGKAVMLDEIINYVQSLQRQVEFLSMKLATVNPRMEVNMEALLSKDMHGPSAHAIHPADQLASGFPYAHQSLQNGISNGMETHPLDVAAQRLNLSMQLPALNGFGEGDSQIAAFWEDDLQSIVQMGFGQNQTAFSTQNFHGSLPTSHMKVEL